MDSIVNRVAVAVVLLALLCVAACGRSQVAPVGWSAEQWREALRQWEEDRWGENPPEPPQVSIADAPILVELFPDEVGAIAAQLLAAEPAALKAVLPRVVELFRESLKQSITSVDAYIALANPGVHPDELGVVNVRRASLRVFRKAGADSYEVAGDLIDLLRRKAIADEFSGSVKGGCPLLAALASVLKDRPDPLVRALQHENHRVKIEVMAAMARMVEPREVLGPALAAQIEEPNDWVLDRAVSALCQIRWSNASVVKRLKARLKTLSTPSFRERLNNGLEFLESIAGD